MNAAALDRLDFLLVIEAILDCGTVTRAAERLHVSQSALSHALAGLRERFGDALFVRAGAVMRPTPLVARLADPLLRSLSIIRDEVMPAAGFDAARSARTWRICVNEVGATVAVPRVLGLLAQRAPHASLELLDTPRDAVGDALASGSADLAIGHHPQLKASLYQQALFVRSWAAIVRSGHPTIGAEVSLAQLCDTPLVACTATPSIASWLDRQLGGRERPRTALQTPHVTALAAIVAQTDWMAFIPAELVRPSQAMAAVRTVRLPFALPRLTVRQHWHRRCNDDPAHRFLRGVVRDALHEERADAWRKDGAAAHALRA